MYIVTCKGFALLIIMGSEFDDWIYWHFFIITINYSSSHIHLPLNDVCLTNLYEESLADLLNSSQSQSHIATDGQSASKSWCRAPSGFHDQIVITV
jgi:hypothetical protein